MDISNAATLDPIQHIGKMGVVPVVTVENPEAASRVAEAFLRGGLSCMEITFRTAAAAGAIRRVTTDYPEMVLGAGTVLTTDQADQALAAGARFIVSPGFGPRVVDWCLKHKMPTLPGVATATDIQMALEYGIKVLKFFPAETLGGLKMIEALASPFREVKFVPLGGINAENLAGYLKSPAVFACGGTWLVTTKLIAAGNFGEIERLAREAVQIVKQVRG